MPCPVIGRTASRVALASLLFAACSSSAGDRAGPTATVGTEPPRTTTTNPYAVPAVIDAAYVNRVLAGLDAAVGDVVRLVLRTKTIPPEAYDRLKAIYGDNDRLQRAIDGIQRDLRNNLSGYKPEPGNVMSVVTDLMTAASTCIFTRVQRDYSPVGTNPLSAVAVQWIGLRPLDAARDPGGYNLTNWALVYEGFPPDHSQPPNPCAN